MEYTMSVKGSSQTLLPLFIDLDGTLIKSDLLVESSLVLVKHNPINIIRILFWICRGKAYLKQMIAERTHIDLGLLPYNKAFLSFLYTEAGRGRELILATASNKVLATQVANHLGIFQRVLASDKKCNLAGSEKVKAIMEICRTGEFDYAGNSMVDLSIWSHCRQAILVNPAKGVEKALRRKNIYAEIFSDRASGAITLLKSVRIHQWSKNMLLFVPLFTSHKLDDTSSIINLVIGFISFCFCASAGYLLNDFLDLDSDRSHPNKCKRPLAAGDVSLIRAGIIMILLILTGLSIAAYVSINLFLILLLYMAISLFYSFYLKKIVLVDVLVLAGLYTLRVIAGAMVIDVYSSFWLLSFSMFLFFSLALVKRCAELNVLNKANEVSTTRRDYKIYDLHHLQNMGISSGYVSVLVIALYINSNEVMLHYSKPKFLWLLCPIILYWISRVWVVSGRGEMNEDPLVFAIRDRVSWFVCVLCALSIILAI
jgi:4-hydroxybenzoate polyprenyltransferase